MKAFHIGLKEELRRLNCITNPYMFDQLLEVDPTDLITREMLTSPRVKTLLIRYWINLSKFIWAEGIRADWNSNLSNEIGKELSFINDAAGLRESVKLVINTAGQLGLTLRFYQATGLLWFMMIP
ncbi:hypothetical protein C5167_008208 [Papaver somniferum]|uniref:Uncharacterized protein n=1 Tax=Papaver somniferum TaxID=3469 RepID=A0A4Y7JX08_PAPSO|nr:hypothetical protein C5167_008208 [Papaver somniferum]